MDAKRSAAPSFGNRSAMPAESTIRAPASETNASETLIAVDVHFEHPATTMGDIFTQPQRVHPGLTHFQNNDTQRSIEPRGPQVSHALELDAAQQQSWATASGNSPTKVPSGRIGYTTTPISRPYESVEEERKYVKGGYKIPEGSYRQKMWVAAQKEGTYAQRVLQARLNEDLKTQELYNWIKAEVDELGKQSMESSKQRVWEWL